MKSTESRIYSFRACLKNKRKGAMKRMLHHLNRRMGKQLAKEYSNATD